MSYREEQAARHALASIYAAEGDTARRDRMIAMIEGAARDRREAGTFVMKCVGYPVAAWFLIGTVLYLLGVPAP